MIPNRTQDVQVTNNISAESTGQFTVDENSLGKIMSVLTNLYSDPELAVVREYLTNALDAQIEAQNTVPGFVWRPIEVTTPSHFSKEYKVRDFGIGMSVDDIKEIYSKYGKSTKESSNDVTGMLGLGSKCALTYTGQFTITGYKNGVRTRAVVSKDDNDIPVFMIVDTRATTEPNGVEIAVPVRDRNSFAEKTNNFLRWWKDGQVLVNGAEPKKHGYTEVKPGVYLIENSGYRYDVPQSYVVMGNVPYAVDSEYVDEGLREAGLGFVAFVPMGAVDFPPSREKLFYNNQTKKAVKAISEGLFETILSKKREAIENAATFREAFKARYGLPHHLANHRSIRSMNYKGESFVENIAADASILDWDWQGHGQIARRTRINLGNAMGGTLIVTGVQTERPTSHFKKKVRHYISENNIDANHAILVDADIDSKWLEWAPRVSAEDIKALKLPKNPANTGPRAEATYDAYTFDDTTKAVTHDAVAAVVANGKTVVYISPSDIRETYRRRGTTEHELAKQLGSKYVLVVMAKNRFEKFLRTHTAITVSDAIQAEINSLVANASSIEQVVSELSYSETQFMSKVNAASIDDPELKTLAELVQKNGGTAPNYSKAVGLKNYAVAARCFPTIPEMKKAANPAKNYPLIDAVGGRQMSHMLVYVNAIYARSTTTVPTV